MMIYIAYMFNIIIGGKLMKLIVDIPENLYKNADILIKEVKYSSFSMFVEVAIKNQLLLEEKTDNDVLDRSIGHFGRKEKEVLSGTSTNEMRLEIKNIFRGKIIQMPTFKDINVFGFEKPENILIWGQINKIFPVKFLLRFFVTNFGDKQEVDFEEFKVISTEAARKFGRCLQQIDESKNTRRDERISIGFPLGEEGKDRFKSDSRFSNQFIGYIRKSGKMSGAMLEMRFASVVKKNNRYIIGITQPGLNFAKLGNPVMDEGNIDSVLTEDETSFYISHCKDYLPGEYIAMRAIVAFISSGKTSRKKLINAIKEMVADWKSWKNERDLISFVDTERSGLTSRLFESNLLTKERIGNTVQYSISSLGEKLLK